MKYISAATYFALFGISNTQELTQQPVQVTLHTTTDSDISTDRKETTTTDYSTTIESKITVVDNVTVPQIDITKYSDGYYTNKYSAGYNTKKYMAGYQTTDVYKPVNFDKFDLENMTSEEMILAIKAVNAEIQNLNMQVHQQDSLNDKLELSIKKSTAKLAHLKKYFSIALKEAEERNKDYNTYHLKITHEIDVIKEHQIKINKKKVIMEEQKSEYIIKQAGLMAKLANLHEIKNGSQKRMEDLETKKKRAVLKKEDIRKIDIEIITLQEEISTAKAQRDIQLQNLSQKLADTEMLVDTITNEENSIKAEIEAASTKLAEIQKQIDDLTIQIDDKTAESNTIKQSIAATEAERVQLDLKLADEIVLEKAKFQKLLDDLKTETESLSDAKEVAEAQARQAIVDREALITDYSEQILTLNSNLSSDKSLLENNQAKQEEISTKIPELQEQVMQLNGQLTAAKEENIRAIAELQDVTQTEKNKLDELTAQYSAEFAELELAKTNAIDTALLTKNDAAMAQNQLDAEISAQKISIEELDSVISLETSKVTQIETEINTLRASIEAKNTQITALEEELVSQKESQAIEVTKKDQQISDLKKLIQDKTEEYMAAKDKMTNEMTEAMKERDLVKARQEVISQEIADKTNEILGENEDHEIQVNSLNSQIVSIKENLEILMKEKAEINAKVLTAADAVKQLENQKIALDAEHQIALKKLADEQASKIADIEAGHKAKLAEFQSQKDLTQKQIDSLGQQLINLNEATNDINDAHKIEVQNLNDQIAQAEEQLNKETVALEITGQELDDKLAAEKSTYQAEMTQLEADMETKRQAITDALNVQVENKTANATEIEKIYEAITNAELELKTKNGELSQIKQSNADKLTTETDLSTANKDLEDKIAQEIADREAAQVNFNSKIEQLKTKFVANLEDLETQLSDAKKAKTEVQQKILDIDTEIMLNKEQGEKDKSVINVNIVSAETERDGLKNEITSLEDTKSGLTADLSTKLAQVEAKKQETENAKAKYESEITQITEKFNSDHNELHLKTEAEMKKQADLKTQITSEVEKRKIDIGVLEAKITNADETLASLATEKAGLNDLILQIQSNIKDKNDEITKMESYIADATAKHADSIADYEKKLADTTAEYQAQVAKKQQELEQALADRDAMIAEYNDEFKAREEAEKLANTPITTDLDDLQKQIDIAQKEFDDVNTVFNEKNTFLMELKIQLESSKTAYETAEQQYIATEAKLAAENDAKLIEIQTLVQKEHIRKLNLDQELMRIQAQIDALKAQYTTDNTPIEIKIEDLQKQLKDTQTHKTKSENDIKEANKQLAEVNKELEDAKTVVMQNRNRLSEILNKQQLEQYEAFTLAQTNAKTATAKKVSLMEQLDVAQYNYSPTTNENEDIDNLEDKIAEMKKDTYKLKEKFEEQNLEMLKKQEMLKITEEQLKETQTSKRSLQADDLMEAEAFINEAQMEVNTVENFSIKNLQEKIKDLKNKYMVLDNSADKTEKMIAINEAKVDSMTDKLMELKRAYLNGGQAKASLEKISELKMNLNEVAKNEIAEMYKSYFGALNLQSTIDAIKIQHNFDQEFIQKQVDALKKHIPTTRVVDSQTPVVGSTENAVQDLINKKEDEIKKIRMEKTFDDIQAQEVKKASDGLEESLDILKDELPAKPEMPKQLEEIQIQDVLIKDDLDKALQSATSSSSSPAVEQDKNSGLFNNHKEEVRYAQEMTTGKVIDIPDQIEHPISYIWLFVFMVITVLGGVGTCLTLRNCQKNQYNPTYDVEETMDEGLNVHSDDEAEDLEA